MTDHAGVMYVFVPLTFSVHFACQDVFCIFPKFSFKTPALNKAVEIPLSFQQGFQLFNTLFGLIFPNQAVFPHGFPQSVENSSTFPNIFFAAEAKNGFCAECAKSAGFTFFRSR